MWRATPHNILGSDAFCALSIDRPHIGDGVVDFTREVGFATTYSNRATMIPWCMFANFRMLSHTVPLCVHGYLRKFTCAFRTLEP